jgi:hypothetical protein
MSHNPLAKDYNSLTPEERFRLILAARDRGDQTEAEQLERVGRRDPFSVPDHAPYMQTFIHLKLLTFIQLLEYAARYLDAYLHMEADLARAAGYKLRANANGWLRFCEQMDVPPFLNLEDYPGRARLQLALDLAENEAFNQDEYLQWLNRTRPEGAPEVTEVPLGEAGVAAETEFAFRKLVRSLGG